MSSLVHSLFLESTPGIPRDLEPAGTSLENPYVYDSAARELKALATRGLLEITDEKVRADHDDNSLICRISFRRLR
jgi:hypothetical protein